jgi:DNA-binding CsgD family transcriptional regulator
MDGQTASIIGRDGERASIERSLAGPRPGALIVEGEAGIGKTTLWTFAIEAARARGDRVLAWRASSAEQELAFGALMGLLDGLEDSALDVLEPPRRRALELALGRIEASGRAPAPGFVGLAVLDLVRGLSGHGPLVVAVDDIQWCDPASSGALAFAARRLREEPIAFVFASRTVTPPRPASELETALPVERRDRVPVGPLTIGALGRLVHDRLGVTHPRPLLVRVHDACAGNPFVALEMSRSLQARGVQPAPGEPFPVSPEAGPLVRDHLATLSPLARRALVVVSMSSQPTIGLLERVIGAGAAAAVDEACRAGVLVAEGARLRPAHPLFASTGYADTPPGERRSLRLALAEAADDPLERAVHRAATVDAPDPGIARELEDAAGSALVRGAPGVAADLLERASGLVSDPDRRASLRIQSAGARYRAGDAEGADALLRATLLDIGPGRRRTDALLALCEIVYATSPAEAVPLLMEALEHAAGDPLLEATVHSYIGGMADADPAAYARSAVAALEILERLDVQPDPDHLACALLERAYLWLTSGQRVALDDIDRAIGLLTGRGDSFIARRAQEVAERCLYHTGRIAASFTMDEAEYRRLSDLGQVGLLPPLVQSMAVLQQLLGDWPAARRYARECVDLVDQGEEVWRDRALMAEARILAWEGDLDPARTMALAGLAKQQAEGDTWESAIFGALLGFIELSVPDPPAALRHLRATADYADQVAIVLPTVFRYLGDYVEAAVLAGDLDLAERVLVERLEGPAERIPIPWILAMGARGRGFLSAARGDTGGAIEWFGRSVAVFDTSLPIPFERARAQLARGQALLRAGRRRAAREDIQASTDVFEQLGAQAWASRARAELARIGGRSASRWELTASERSVADLAAHGHSNREIADRLVLSVRTVESHLGSAYRKLGVRSRGQLIGALVASPGESSAAS